MAWEGTRLGPQAPCFDYTHRHRPEWPASLRTGIHGVLLTSPTQHQGTDLTSPAFGSKSTVDLPLAQHQRTTFPGPSKGKLFPGGLRNSVSSDQT